jgi:iron complex outermembrane receptor protein
MRKILALLAVIFTLSLASEAQTANQVTGGKIVGTVIDGNTKTIESATISLQKAADSSIVKMSIADKTGKFEFDNVAAGKYFVSISATGHTKGFSETIEISAAQPSVTLKTIELVPQAKAIGGVEVTSRRPMFEQKPGKTVVNVDAAPTNAGLNALELLEKSPGISVDNDGNISLKGKQGVLILLDGKQTYMSGTDLANLLKNMQSSNIDQIEIMTNPPAKYDAAGNSGIINIKTKKTVIRGMNGNGNLGYTQGKYARTNNGINLNYRNDKLNLFGGYNAGTWEGYNKLTISRNFYKDGLLNGSSDQVSRPHFEGVFHSIKAGMDYYFSKNDVAGIVVNGNFNNGKEDPMSKSNLRDNSGNILSKLYSISDNRRTFAGITANVNYKHTYDSTGREISTDLDYAHYDTRNKTELNTASFDANDIKMGNDVILRGRIPSVINIYTAKVDYLHPLKNGVKLEAGAKSSYVKTDNQVEYLRSNGNGWKEDDRSNHFIYTENINAAYVILSKSFKKWSVIAGLRLENTNSKGHQIKNDSIVNRHYTNLFPNLGVGYEMNEKNQFNFSYSRRVNRPDYESLNPFVFFLDSLTYGKGNPYLQPQFTHNLELSHTFRRFLTTTINFSQTNDIITQLLRQDTEKKITFQTRENFNKMQQFGLAVMINVPVQKWWNLNVYTNVFNNHYTGIYQPDPADPKVDKLDIEFTSFMGNVTNSFTIGKKGWSAELSGFYRSKGVDGLLVANRMWAVNSAIAKQILKKKGSLKVGVRDIFWSQQFSGYAKYSDVDVNISSRRDTRQFNITFNYRFGKTNIAPARRKNSGAADEQNRVNTGAN